MKNVVPHFRAPLTEYIKKTGYPEVLNFERSSLEDTGYKLRLTVGNKLLSLPKTLWIHQQSDSILGYHKNFFAPDHLQTTRTVYSYAKGDRHYYADGMYVKKTGITYLRQKVTENQPTLRSWQIPTPNWHCNLQQRHYCSPRLGDLEYTFLRAMNTSKQSVSLQHLCGTYLSNFTTIQQFRTDYYQRAKKLFPILNYTIFS